MSRRLNHNLRDKETETTNIPRVCVSLIFVLAVAATFLNGCGHAKPTPTTYSMSGTVSLSSTGLQGVTINLNGTASGTVPTDASGNYSFTGLTNGSYTITPSKSGYTFSPSNSAQTVNGASITGVNFTATIPNADWYSSLVWMRDNTPSENYTYPDSAYGVISWWDYGYWITDIAHRIPYANPVGYYPPPDQPNVAQVAQFFMAQNESAATEILNALKAKYVIVDVEMATGKFYAMTRFAGGNETQYFDVYYDTTANQTGWKYFYYPEYYRSMCSRLYNFGGNETIPTETRVISYQESTDQATGIIHKVVTDSQIFSTYADAEAYLQTHPDYRIVGTNPFDSPVPLEKLEHYQLAHHSDTPTVTFQLASTQEPVAYYVEIFEYTP